MSHSLIERYPSLYEVMRMFATTDTSNYLNRSKGLDPEVLVDKMSQLGYRYCEHEMVAAFIHDLSDRGDLECSIDVPVKDLACMFKTGAPYFATVQDLDDTIQQSIFHSNYEEFVDVYEKAWDDVAYERLDDYEEEDSY